MTLGFLVRAMLLVVAAVLALGGRATVPEAAEENSRRAVFQMLDTNGDGLVDRNEFEMNKVAVIFRKTVHREPILRIEETRLSPRMFNELDLNHTGTLDVHDVANAPMFQFTWWDRDQDGVIGWAEFNAGMDELER
jgi:Ca2+-binding EF-hand superfamily protein